MRRERLQELEKRIDFLRNYHAGIDHPDRGALLAKHVKVAEEQYEVLITTVATTGDVQVPSMDALEELVLRAERVQYCLQVVRDWACSTFV